MSWLKSRRLHYLAGLTALLFVLFAALRGLFLLGFSAVDSIGEPHVLRTLGIGLRFDLRLALLLMLPVGILLALPKLRLARFRAVRWLLRGYLLLAMAALGLLYIVDFGHYAYLGVRLNGQRAGDVPLTLACRLPDVGETWTLFVRHGALGYREGAAPDADASVTIDRTALNGVILGTAKVLDLVAAGQASIDGDVDALHRFVDLLDEFDFWFNIVTP